MRKLVLPDVNVANGGVVTEDVLFGVNQADAALREQCGCSCIDVLLNPLVRPYL